MKNVLALAALLACLAGVPAFGQPTLSAPGATPSASHCVGCDVQKTLIDVYRIVLKQLQDAIDARTKRMDALAGKAFGTTPPTQEERDEAKRLDGELRRLIPARDGMKDAIERLERAIADCAKQCPAPAAPGVGAVPGTAPGVAMPRAACPECQGFAQALFMLEVAAADVEKLLQQRQATLKLATARITGSHSAAEYRVVQALREEVANIEWRARSLRRQAGKMREALDDCNRRCTGDDRRNLRDLVIVANDLMDADLFGYDREEPPEHGGKALCPECEPAQRRLEAAVRAYDASWERYGALSEQMSRLYDERWPLETQLERDQAELEKVRYLGTGPERAERMGALESAIRTARSRIEGIDEKIVPLRRERQEVRRAQEQLRRDREAARQALVDCNYERCKTRVQVDTVVGVTGTNPFDPDNPTGTAGGTQPPPQPQGPGTLQFSAQAYSGAEGGAVLVVVTRAGGSKGAVGVQFATGSGTATAGSDFQPANGALNWADGDATPKSFSIPLLRDNQAEGPESFPVNLANPTGGAAIGAPAAATVTIADADTPAQTGSVQFSASSYATAEGQGTVTITVTRTGGASGAASVQFFTGPSSAAAGSDYTATNGMLTWAAGDATPKSFTVAILDDTAVEGRESFFVTLNNPTGASLGAPATVSVTIDDNDVATGPCGQQGNAWQPNTGAAYVCSGSCNPTPSPQTLTINGDRVTLTPFHAGGAAAFVGCTASLNSERNDLAYFGQANHRATITRSSSNAFNANITSNSGGTCFFSCTRSGP